MAEILAENVHSIEDLSVMKREQLLDISTIGPKIADSIQMYFLNPVNKNLIRKFSKANVRLSDDIIEEDKSDLLKGSSFVITGRLEGFSRVQLELFIKDQGGVVSSTVTKKTNYLIVGDDPGSKLAKAQELKITILNEREFKLLLEDI